MGALRPSRSSSCASGLSGFGRRTFGAQRGLIEWESWAGSHRHGWPAVVWLSALGGSAPPEPAVPVPARRSPRASSMSKHIGIPIKVLHDAEGHTVTIELKNGETYRGKLDEAEDNMNCHLSNCTKTGRDGRVTTLAKCAASRRGQHGPLARTSPRSCARHSPWHGSEAHAQQLLRNAGPRASRRASRRQVAPTHPPPPTHTLHPQPCAAASCVEAMYASWCSPIS